MREKIYILVIGIFIGVILGYAWRMTQVEPYFENEIKSLTTIQKRLNKDIYNIELKLILIEDKLNGLKNRLDKKKTNY